MKLLLLLLASCLLLLYAPGAAALSINDTQLLWKMCIASTDCKGAFNLEADFNAGSTPLANGDLDQYAPPSEDFIPESFHELMILPQFEAFRKIVAAACARLEAPGAQCSPEYLAEIPLVFTADPQATLYRRLWVSQMMFWAATSGFFCGFNEVITIGADGSLNCTCRLNKNCNPNNNVSSLDGTFLAVLIAILLGALILWSLWQAITFFWPMIKRSTANRGETEAELTRGFTAGSTGSAMQTLSLNRERETHNGGLGSNASVTPDRRQLRFGSSNVIGSGPDISASSVVASNNSAFLGGGPGRGNKHRSRGSGLVFGGSGNSSNGGGNVGAGSG